MQAPGPRTGCFAAQLRLGVLGEAVEVVVDVVDLDGGHIQLRGEATRGCPGLRNLQRLQDGQALLGELDGPLVQFGRVVLGSFECALSEFQ